MSFSVDKKYSPEVVPLEIEYNGKTYKGNAIPLPASNNEDVCFELDVTLNGEYMGIIQGTKDGWQIEEAKDKGLVNAIGEKIIHWYE